jgi:DNA helicase II / ATP-dependent DNA helicase PcrA
MVARAKFEQELRAVLVDPTALGRLVTDGPDRSHFVVAGPGTGKTTALAVRAVKLILVDEIDPAAIIAVTFMRRAAAELRSKILQLGDKIRGSLKAQSAGAERATLGRIDFNRIRTGTLDSFADEILTEFRTPNDPPPVVVDPQIANVVMLREGLFVGGRFRDPNLNDFYALIHDNDRYGLGAAALASMVREFHERIIFDKVDLQAFGASNSHPGIRPLVDAVLDYRRALEANDWVDYAMLEERLLQRLSDGSLKEFTSGIKAVLVDEYQDTNHLQERIYFSLAKAACAHGGGLSVVGDDDQALYRFRGATTDLFTEFPKRFKKSRGVAVHTVYLSENRRSTQPIIDHLDSFVTLDREYGRVRVGRKPKLRRARVSTAPVPVLGMFRPDVDTLATDLSALLDGVVNGNGWTIPGTDIRIEKDPFQGSASDLVLLSSSPAEEGGQGKQLLPAKLRAALMNLANPIKVYNPRGRPITSVGDVATLLGLVIECLDPDSSAQTDINNLPQGIEDEFDRWRDLAHAIVYTNPRSAKGKPLAEFVRAWTTRTPSRGKSWPTTVVPVLNLIYDLVTWFPFFQSDIEGLAYLEVVNRMVTTTGNLSAYDGGISFANEDHRRRSFRDLAWYGLVPLAQDLVDVDEDLMETLPRDRFGVLSIHQAKGLEFPVAMVDVGSRFTGNYAKQAPNRFPLLPGNTSNIEDQLRPFSPLLRPTRPGISRCFDDLVRRFFVAYSRPKDVLILAGLDDCLSSAGVRNVAIGWDRSGTRHPAFLGRVQLV